MKYLLLISAILSIINSSQGCKYNTGTFGHGDTWIEKDAFLMKCNMPGDGSWKIEIIACQTPSGATVPVNSSFIEENSEWNCTQDYRGRVVLHRGVNPNAKCGEHEQGEHWREKAFLFECVRGGQQKFIACIGENEEQIKIGESKEINGYIVTCEKYENGTVAIHGVRKESELDGTQFKMECVDSDGNHHAIDSWWIDNHRFNKTCLASGKIDVLNCISKEGHQVPVNEEKVIDNVKFLCEKTKDGAIRFASGPAEDF